MEEKINPKMNNRIVKNFILILIPLCFYSCLSKEDALFDKEVWKQEKSPFLNSRKRKAMLNDLRSNYLSRGKCKKDLLDLLGPPDKLEVKENAGFTFSYLVDENYEYLNPEPVTVVVLLLELDLDTCLVSNRIIENEL